ncbi:MAG: hypothetical protein LBK60_05460 [Verrucomicrobiales bacterium]|jgi:hypothetical protein|nr:hypothetical protein [Verrucomicrobiales bacterium]
MKIFRLVCGLALSAVLCFGANADRDQQYNDWMKTFYQTKDAQGFDGFWRNLVQEKWLENETAVAPIIGFVSQVLRQYPELIKGRLDDLKKIPPSQLKTCALMLWYSDTPAAKKILAQIDYRVNEPVPSIGDKKIERPEDLDFCWGWFFATGDTRALDPIISALDFGKYAGALKKFKASAQTVADRDAAVKDAMFGAARWSLTANGKQDPTVSAHLRAARADAATPLARKQALGVIVQKLAPAAALDAGSVGDFGATVCATADRDWKKKWTTVPENEPFQSTITNKLRRGETVTLLLTFTNPLPAANGKINVTYDAKLTQPNGKVNEMKNLFGADGDVTGKKLTNVFLVEELLHLIAEPGDPAGEWLFEFAVHDLNRKVTVPLKLTLTLTE